MYLTLFKDPNKFLFILTLGFLLSSLDTHALEDPKTDINIDDVFLAQTHVLRPTDLFFKLTADRVALLKVNITSSSGLSAPAVSAIISLNGQTTILRLKGPSKLPTYINPDEHSFDNSFTVDIPRQWVKPGFSILIKAGTIEKKIDNILVSADHVLRFRFFDFIVFGDPKEYHPFQKDTYKEMEAKLPISGLDYIYAGVFEMPAFVVFPENNNTTPARIATRNPKDNVHSMTFLSNMDALQRANGELYTTYYGAGMSTAGGGWGGGTRFAGISTFGVFWHEFGHALSLSHNNDNPKYPYSSNGLSQFRFHVGPNWGYDPIKRYFIPPTIQKNALGAEEYVKNGEMGRFKHDPMWQKNPNQQEEGYYFMHFSDYNAHKIKTFLEKTYERKMPDGSYAKWNTETSSWKTIKRRSWEVPTRENLPIYSLLGMASVTQDANLIYNPLAYTGNLVRTFDPTQVADIRAMREERFCTPCNLTLKVKQGGKTKYFALKSNFKMTSSQFERQGTRPFAVNVPQSDGKIELMELYYTPDLKNGFKGNEQLLKRWVAGQVNIPKAPSIGGKVWLDENRNGRMDQDEKGIPGVQVDAWRDTDGDGFANAKWRYEPIFTDQNGDFEFGGLEPGQWQVILHNTNFKQGKILNGYFNSPGESSPNDKVKGDDNGVKGGEYGKHWNAIVSKPFAIRDGGDPYQKVHPNSNLTVDFGFYKTNSTSIGGSVWFDVNQNNQKDEGERGIAGVHILLWKDKDGDGQPEYTGKIGHIQTDQNGNYIFDNLEPGIYQVFVWEMENFKQGGALFGMVNCEGAGDPNILTSFDDNGIPGGATVGGPPKSFISQPIHISDKTLQKGVYQYDKEKYFISINGREWIEKSPTKTFNFECYATDKDYVYLKAHVLIKLPRNGGRCYYKGVNQNNEPWNPLYMTQKISEIDDLYDGQFSNGTVDFGFQRK